MKEECVLKDTSMKILFVCRKFHDVAGGVEKMAISLMNEMTNRGFEIHLITWDEAFAKAYYPMDDRICWYKLDTGDATQKASWLTRLKRQLLLRRAVKSIRPDCVIAFQHGPFLTIALSILGLQIPTIAAERNAPERFDHLRSGKIRSLIFQSFRLAKVITVQFDEYRSGYPNYLNNRIISIPNPVNVSCEKANPIIANNGYYYILTVGRLSYQKNVHSLIDAFSKVVPHHPNWKLKIVGDGEDKAELTRVAFELGVGEQVEFVGTVKNVVSLYSTSHLFVLSSRWEGFPNALAEALSCGLPCIGFSECAGVNRLIIDGKNGILALGNGDVESLAKALDTLMDDHVSRKSMGEQAVYTMQKYSPDKVYELWEKTFHQVARK